MNAVVKFTNDNRLFLILAVATMFSYFWLFSNKKRLNVGDGMAFLLAAAHTMVGVACVKVFAFLESGAQGGGMSLYGAVFFLPVIYYLAAKVTKRDAVDIFDIFTICVIFTLLCSRINCLLSGCCLGLPMFGSETLRWPTRQMEMVFYLILLVWLGKKSGKAKWKGKLYPMYMMTYGVFRFFVEWLRESERILGFLHISHIWSVVAVLAGLTAYRAVENKKDARKRTGEEKTCMN